MAVRRWLAIHAQWSGLVLWLAFLRGSKNRRDALDRTAGGGCAYNFALEWTAASSWRV